MSSINFNSQYSNPYFPGNTGTPSGQPSGSTLRDPSDILDGDETGIVNPTSNLGIPPSQMLATPGNFNPGPNTPLAKWEGGINVASKITGLDPSLIGGQMWAESRGNPNSNSKNADGTTDLGLMQISQERWERDIVPTLTPDQISKIKELTGKDPSQLNMNDPNENIIGGSLELAHWIKEKGSVEAGLSYYVNGGDEGITSGKEYVNNVLNFQHILATGGKLPD